MTVSIHKTIEIAFGRGTLPVSLPSAAEPAVIRKSTLPKVPDASAAIRQAFEAPIGGMPLRELARGRTSACVLICDVTRPVPNRLFLRPMIETLTINGIPADRITVQVATGLHRPNEGDELAELVGDPWVLEHVRVENHYARDETAHVDFGFTQTRKTPVK